MSKTLKILRIIATTNPEHGGPIEGLKRSAGMMRDWGHETEVVSTDDPAAPYLSDFPFAVHPMGPSRNRYGFTQRLTPWVAQNAARFDVAVVHGLWNYASIGAWRALRGSSLPYVLFTHGMMDPWFNSVQPLKRWAKQAYWLALQGHVLHDAKAVLFTSEEERRLARTAFVGPRYKERVVAYGAADAPADAVGDDLATRLPALGTRKYLLFLSRIHPKKGCDLLVQAFAQVAKAHPDIDLVIAGPDQTGMRADLEKLAAEHGVGQRIHWPGMMQGAAKWSAFRGAEAFILPSHQENFGIVVAEAMACGTPALISDKVNIWREVEASGGGFVAPDTLEGTRNLLTRFLVLSPEQRQHMRTAARAAYEKHYSIEGAATDLLTVLEQARLGRVA